MSHGGPGHGPPHGHNQPPSHHEPPHLQQHGSGPYGGGGAYTSGHSSGGEHQSSNPVEIKGTVYYIYSEANDDFNVAVKGGKIVVSKSDTSDPSQQWIKDESWSTKAKDSAGMPAFALINKGTGTALAHPKEVEEPVYLTTYHQKTLNEVYLWTLGKDEGHGFHALRPVNNINMNLDIDHGSKKYGGVTEGKSIIVFTWKGEDNQKWILKKVEEHSSNTHHHFHF